MTHPPTVETRRFSPRVRRLIADAGPLVALIVLIIVFAVANPVFISPGNIGILLSQAAVPLVIATGLTFVILLGGIDLSVEGVVATSSLVFALTVANDRNDLALGLLGAGTGPAAAADGDVPWTVGTAAGDFGSGRQNYSYTLDPGGRLQDGLVVTNHGTTPLRLAVYAADGFTTKDGRFDLVTQGGDG